MKSSVNRGVRLDVLPVLVGTFHSLASGTDDDECEAEAEEEDGEDDEGVLHGFACFW